MLQKIPGTFCDLIYMFRYEVMIMQIGEWVHVKGCGRSLVFQIFAFARNKVGKKLAILKNDECTEYEFRFVPVEQLDLV